MTKHIGALAAVTALSVCGIGAPHVSAQRAVGPAPAPGAITGPLRLELAEGSLARYRVQEQLAGISFPSDAAGATSAVSGTLVLGADGSVNAKESKITVDLRTLRSDQDQRDGFIRGERLLDTGKFPFAEFIPRRVVGLPSPLPAGRGAQAGFQLVGDMTIHGVTSEVTWSGIVTFNADIVAGRATTEFTFEKFGLPKPQLARLLSVADNINLELEFRFKRVPM